MRAALCLAAILLATLSTRSVRAQSLDDRSRAASSTPRDADAAGLDASARGRSDPEAGARHITFSRLWRDRPRPWGLWRMGASQRGFASDGRQYRPGLDAMPTGWSWWPRLLRPALDVLSIHIEDELRYGFRNVDTGSLMSAEWPGTIPEDLVGGDGGLVNFALADVSVPIVPDVLHVSLEAIDQRVWMRSPLGTRAAQEESRPRYTLDLTWRPGDRAEVRVGARYESIEVLNSGLSSWHLADAARDRRVDEVSVVVSGRLSIDDRQELSLTADLVHLRDDALSRGGLLSPGHDNLDTFTVWGNNPWTLRQRRTTERVELRYSGFLDGLFFSADAHTLSIGASLEHTDGEDDDTRNGGFTFRDAGACDATQCTDRQSFAAIDPSARDSWLLETSDRGDELHAHSRILSLAAWIEDAMEIDSWARLTAGVRLEHTEGGLDRAPGILSALTLAPRVEASVDLTPDHLTSLYFQYGRHYHAMVPAMLHRAQEGAAYSPLQYWDWTGPRDEALPITADDPRWQRSATLPAVLGRTLDDARLPYVDRLVAGLVFGLDDLRLRTGVRYEYRRYGDYLAVYDAAFSPETYTRASEDAERFGPGATDTAPHYDLRAPGTQDYVLGNAPGGWRESHQLDVMASMPVADFLELAGRLTITDDRGNLYAPDGISLEWRDPSGQLGSNGRMPWVSPVRLWLQAILDLPAAISIYVDYRFTAGSYYSRIRRVQPENNQRVFVWDAAGRGAYQYPDQHQLDVRAQIRLDGVLDGSMRVWVEGRNLLNLGAVTAVREVNTSFRSVAALQTPFELRVGASYDY